MRFCKLAADGGWEGASGGAIGSRARSVSGRHALEDPDAIDEFLAEYEEIRRTRIVTHPRLAGTRLAIGTTVRNQSREVRGVGYTGRPDVRSAAQGGGARPSTDPPR